MIEKTLEKIKEAEEKREKIIEEARREVEKLKKNFSKEKEEYLKEIRERVQKKKKELQEKMEQELASILARKQSEKEKERELLMGKVSDNREKAIIEILEYLGFSDGSS